MSNKPGPKKRRPEDEHAAWLTRADASDMLGCSIQTLQNKEREGKLHPVKVTRLVQGVERYVYVYDPKELAQLPRRNKIDNPGERSARAFELFDAGMTDRRIVVELRETPDWVRDQRTSWLDGGGVELIITPEAHAELTAIVGTFAGVADLVAAVKHLAKHTSSPHPPITEPVTSSNERNE